MSVLQSDVGSSKKKVQSGFNANKMSTFRQKSQTSLYLAHRILCYCFFSARYCTSGHSNISWRNSTPLVKCCHTNTTTIFFPSQSHTHVVSVQCDLVQERDFAHVWNNLWEIPSRDMSAFKGCSHLHGYICIRSTSYHASQISSFLLFSFRG